MVAFPDRQLLAAYTTFALDAMLLAYHVFLPDEVRS
jgi:hypothetical protein